MHICVHGYICICVYALYTHHKQYALQVVTGHHRAAPDSNNNVITAKPCVGCRPVSPKKSDSAHLVEWKRFGRNKRVVCVYVDNRDEQTHDANTSKQAPKAKREEDCAKKRRII